MKSLILALALLSSRLGAAPQANLKDGVALSGYDAVSYFETTGPQKGSKDFMLSLNGASYLFASQKHLDLFKAKPEKYEPAYGGWCAYAMSRGECVEVNPLRYKILGGRLLLFYDALWNNTLIKWNADEANLLKQAEAHWKALNAAPAPASPK